MTHAIRIETTGGPEVLEWQEVDVPDPGAGEVRIRTAAAGLNYIDTYHRSGAYALPLPSGMGLEASGVVEAVGADVADLAEGDRVCYGVGPLGAYTEARVMPAVKLVKTPDAIDDRTATAMMLKAMTAQYLIRRTFRVEAGMPVLFHAAAGGVGLIACQWLKALGATVIGTVGSAEKAELTRAHGCEHTILYREEDWVARVRELTGNGVPVVYDGVGQATWDGSLDCLATRGMMVSFGAASGPVESFAPGVLAAKGSLFLTRPSLMDYAAIREELVETAQDLFDVVASSAVRIDVNQTYALADAAQAHRDLEARKTTGSTVLLP